MMGCTDRHGRYLLRLLSGRARLYTEMIPVGALLHGDAERALRFDPAEHPVAIQLGGSDPADLARSARRAERAGYDEVNLNVGCPSPRVQRGSFGAALMARPDLVAECVAAMRDAASIPVTVKTRIGIDDLDSPARLRDFAGIVAEAGCDTLIVHARKAWLSGLSPRQNREIPPLRHDRVYRLKREMPALEIVLNGGITTLEEAQTALRRVDGVMLGRAAWHDLWLLAGVDRALFGDTAPPPERSEVAARYLAYAKRQRGARLGELVRPLLGSLPRRPGRPPLAPYPRRAHPPSGRDHGRRCPGMRAPSPATADREDFGRREARSRLRAGPRRLRRGKRRGTANGAAGPRDGRWSPARAGSGSAGGATPPSRFSGEDEPRIRPRGRDGA